MSELVKIDISNDKMMATVTIQSIDPPSRDETVRALAEAGVVYGVFEDVIDFSCGSRPGDRTMIARGDPPAPGQDGRVDLLWEVQVESGENKNGKVDYRETSKVISVEEGSLLARKYPSTEGQAGKSVTGEPVPPPPVREAKLAAGKGVRLDEQGCQAFATTAGRPLAKKSGLSTVVMVEPCYTVVGDVSIKTGNIRFKGDVRIGGNVTETMTVESSGNVAVFGIVTGAKIICGGSLTVHKNVISSQISAGLSFAESSKLKYIIQDLYADLTGMLKVMDQLRSKVAGIEKLPFFQVVNGLIENNFKNIRPNAKQLAASANFNLPQEVADAVEKAKLLTGIQYTQDEFKNLLQKLSQSTALLNAGDMEDASVALKSAFGSTINCAGTVLVTGQGCVNTTIYAGKEVKVTGSFKGGEIHCEGNVSIGELGSNLGAPPLIRVKSKKTVHIKKTLPGSTIQIGANRVNITRELANARYRLGATGEIEIV